MQRSDGIHGQHRLALVGELRDGGVIDGYRCERGCLGGEAVLVIVFLGGTEEAHGSNASNPLICTAFHRVEHTDSRMAFQPLLPIYTVAERYSGSGVRYRLRTHPCVLADHHREGGSRGH